MWDYRVKNLSGPDAGTAWRYISFYVPLWLVIAGVAVAYCRVRGTLSGVLETTTGGTQNSGTVATQREMLAKLVRLMQWYPLVLIACWTLPTINRLNNSANPEHPQLWLFVVSSMTVRLQGLCNALIYGNNAR